MNREEKLIELARLIRSLREQLGSGYLPAADTRRYNALMKELYGDGEDPEIQEGKHAAALR